MPQAIPRALFSMKGKDGERETGFKHYQSLCTALAPQGEAGIGRINTTWHSAWRVTSTVLPQTSATGIEANPT